jgi:hypothetical protein
MKNIIEECRRKYVVLDRSAPDEQEYFLNYVKRVGKSDEQDKGVFSKNKKRF